MVNFEIHCLEQIRKMLNYLFCQTSNLLQITSCTCCHLWLTKDHFLCSSATKSTNNSRKELLLRDKGRIISRNKPGKTPCLTTWNEGHFLNRIMPWSQSTAQKKNIESYHKLFWALSNDDCLKKKGQSKNVQEGHGQEEEKRETVMMVRECHSI